LRIRTYLITILIVAALGGLLVAGAINANFSRLQVRSHEVARNSMALTHLEYFVTSMEQMLITADLVIASGETYLADGLISQVDGIRQQLSALRDFPLLTGASEQLTRVDALLEDIVASVHLQMLSLEKSATIVESVVLAFDEVAQALPALTEQLHTDAERNAQMEAEELARDQLTRSRMAAFLAVLYVLMIILVLRWSLSKISAPLQQLTNRADDSMELNRRFRFDATGPTEIMRLGNTIDRFVGSLETRVADRTTDLKAKTSALQHEIEVRKRTEIKLNQAKVAAEAATQAKSDFLAVVSHELRTPMNAVLGTIELLKDSDLSAEQRIYTDSAHQSGNALMALLNDVLDMSKIEAGHMTLESVDLRIDEIIDGIIELFTGEAIEKGLILAGMIEPDTPLAIRGDPLRIRQILMNLVSNAIKFTDHGHVYLKVEALRTHEGEPELRFEVSDTGIGIDSKDQDELFTEFTQLDSSYTRRQGGTGLGLAICKRIAKMMDGQLKVESTVGSGSRFWFSLPLTQASSLKLSASETTEFVQSRLENRIVTVLGNDPQLNDCVTQILSPWIDRPIIRSEAELLTSMNSAGLTPIAVICGHSGDNTWQDTGRRLRERLGTRIRIIALAPSAPTVQEDPETSSIFDVSHLGGLQPLTLLKEIGSNETSSQNPERQRQPANGSGRVLLVEDSEANSLVASAILSKAGYAVDTVANGELALTAARNNTYDTILMDLQMPVMDGYAATAGVRCLESPVCDVPIVALTANVMAESEATARATELDGFLAKPFVRKDLLDAVQHWTAVGRKRRNKYLASQRRIHT